MKILVTGGLGYIGSHVSVMLLERNIEVLCIDNLDNSRLEVLEGINNITQKQKEFINSNEIILKKLGRINNIFNDDLDKPAVTMVVAGDLFKIYFDKDVDIKLIKKNLTNKQSRLEQEMNKISQRLQNKSFVDRAPKEIVEQEKNNYNNLKNDVEKILVTIKGIQ